MSEKSFRVLVVYKKDAYQHYMQEQRDAHLLRLLRKKQKDVLEIQRSHIVHQASMEAVVHALRLMPIEFELANRTDLKITKRYNLVISVGGDGTFLQAAQGIHNTPILGVNSDPSRSEAVFCAATSRTFATLCRKALQGELPGLRLYRLQLALNAKPLVQRSLNDILVVHDDPATMSRYRISIGKRQEVHKSSGLWVSTAAGSSSAVLAAGGVRLRWDERRFQYRPRELYYGRLSRYRLKGGVLNSSSCVDVIWLMRKGSAFIDGPHIRIPLRFADRLTISLSLNDPISVLGLFKV